MLLWFAGGSVLLVRQVFGDPRIDYRLVAAGALLPDVVDGLWGGARALHSLATAAVAMVVVMLATRGRRVARRRALAVPIGLFLHLVLDGMWARTEVFWWPFTGWAFGDEPVPSFDRPMLLLVAMEAAGLVALLRFRRLQAAEDHIGHQ